LKRVTFQGGATQRRASTKGTCRQNIILIANKEKMGQNKSGTKNSISWREGGSRRREEMTASKDLINHS